MCTNGHKTPMYFAIAIRTTTTNPIILLTRVSLPSHEVLTTPFGLVVLMYNSHFPPLHGL